ncbi:MAG: leucyl aminopeptidase family protein [Bdellovibrionia bacterium]
MRKFKFVSWIDSAKVQNSVHKVLPQAGFVFILGKTQESLLKRILSQHAQDWQKTDLAISEKEIIHFHGHQGHVWIVKLKALENKTHQGRLGDSLYSQARDLVGTVMQAVKACTIKNLYVDFTETHFDQNLGALVGMEMASYNFKEIYLGQMKHEWPQLHLSSSGSELPLKEATTLAKAVNLSRHFVNLPPNDANPATLSQWAKTELSKIKNVSVEVWNEARLKKENMNLHLAVGQGSHTPPCLVHIRYRPTKKAKRAPQAFVGKGITFDTGGLDIKPSSGMRLMKKDMGGAAAIMGVALWAAESQYPGPLDFYLALAENSVDAKSFRPSDVIIARSGMSVEIDNTDAEGRLVLADALDVAVTQKGENKPNRVINVATLTGAIKVGLGSEIAGLFSNDDDLAEDLNLAGFNSGELNWRMPLHKKYWSSMSSHFADCKNSGEGFGGAITAALFLEKFVKDTPWAHLDIYAWTDKAQGPYSSAGGSGQPVQTLIKYLLESSAT